MANGKSKKVREWKPSGKYRKVTPDKVCAQLEQLNRWVYIFKGRTDLDGYKLADVKGEGRPNGSGSPPKFP